MHSSIKIIFLKEKLVPLLQQIPTDQPPAWGRMSLPQMIEHFSDSVRLATGKVSFDQIITPEEHIPKMQDFIRSNKPFRENTKNPNLPEAPALVKIGSVALALEELQQEISHFFTFFTNNNQHTTLNPIFGHLNFELNLLLLYKHAVHHLR